MSQRFWSICRSDDVADPGCREFELHTGKNAISGFVVHWQGQWYAYKNSCPHTGVTLNWLPNQFFDAGQDYIQCGTHGALFQPQDGRCVYGPCVGRFLEKLPVMHCEDEIVIDGTLLRND